MNYHIHTGSSLFILTEKELLSGIFNEILKPGARIQKGRGGEWKKLNESPEWKLFYSDDNTNKDWILLKKQGKSPYFRQKGPYSTGQIRFFLKTGLCDACGFIWKKGFTEWKRISLVADFSTSPARTIEDLLTGQSRKYKNQRVRMVRYSPSAVAPGRAELQKSFHRI